MRRQRNQDDQECHQDKKQRRRIASDDEDEDEDEGMDLHSDDDEEEEEREEANQGHGRGHRRLIYSDDEDDDEFIPESVLAGSDTGVATKRDIRNGLGDLVLFFHDCCGFGLPVPLLCFISWCLSKPFRPLAPSSSRPLHFTAHICPLHTHITYTLTT